MTFTVVDPRDGNAYRAVQIGAQCWLAENLRYLPVVCPATTTPDGSALCYVYDYHGYSVEEAKATANYRNYGALYNWEAAQQVCPPGWHLPSDAEWSALTDYAIRSCRHVTAATVGRALKSRRQVGLPLVGEFKACEHPRWEMLPRHQGSGVVRLLRTVRAFMAGVRVGYGTDELGFSALPGGRCTYGGFYRIGVLGYWWSASEASPLRVWGRRMTRGGEVKRSDVSKSYGLSVRCVQD